MRGAPLRARLTPDIALLATHLHGRATIAYRRRAQRPARTPTGGILLDGGLAGPRVAAHVGHTNAAFTRAKYGDTRTTPTEAGNVLSEVRAGR
ncbi:hypothetical protein GCM10009793_08830 [Brachybacterium phenoliresistens]